MCDIDTYNLLKKYNRLKLLQLYCVAKDVIVVKFN